MKPTIFLWPGNISPLLIFGYALLLANVGCRQEAHSTQPIHGEIFLVLKNGEALRLAGAPVLIIDAQLAALRMTEMEEAVRDREAELLRRQDALSRQIEILAPEVIAKTQPILSQIRTSSEYVQNNLSSLPGSQLNLISKSVSNLTQQVESISKPVRDLQTELDGIRKELLPQATARFRSRQLIRPWPNTLAQCVTDSKGAFSVLSPGTTNVSVVATCSREIGGIHETYIWCVPVHPQAGQVLLHNANITLELRESSD